MRTINGHKIRNQEWRIEKPNEQLQILLIWAIETYENIKGTVRSNLTEKTLISFKIHGRNFKQEDIKYQNYTMKPLSKDSRELLDTSVERDERYQVKEHSVKHSGILIIWVF